MCQCEGVRVVSPEAPQRPFEGAESRWWYSPAEGAEGGGEGGGGGGGRRGGGEEGRRGGEEGRRGVIDTRIIITRT